jgi:hypothetical protein
LAQVKGGVIDALAGRVGPEVEGVPGPASDCNSHAHRSIDLWHSGPLLYAIAPVVTFLLEDQSFLRNLFTD